MATGLIDAIVWFLRFRLADSIDGKAEDDDENNGKNMLCQSHDPVEWRVGFQGSPNSLEEFKTRFALKESNRIKIISLFGRA